MGLLNKKIVFVVLVLAVIAGMLLIYKNILRKSVLGQIFDTQVKTAEESLDFSFVPPAFPSDLPLEQGIVLENKISENQVPDTGSFEVNSETQSVRKFLSAKSPEENFALYEAYLSERGWEIVYRLDEPDVKVLMAKKSGEEGLIKITISRNTLTGDVGIEISMTE